MQLEKVDGGETTLFFQPSRPRVSSCLSGLQLGCLSQWTHVEGTSQLMNELGINGSSHPVSERHRRCSAASAAQT